MLIKVRHHQLSIRAPYGAGHSLTAEEAEALNALRAENIRNILGKHETKLRRGEVRVLTDSEVSALRARCLEVDASYAFQKRPERSVSAGTLEHELLSLARERVEAQVKAAGRSPSHAVRDEMIASFIKDPEVRAEAQRRLEAKQSIVAQSIEELQL